MTVAVDDDGTLLMGAPGAGLWSGVLFALSTSNNELRETIVELSKNYSTAYNLMGYSMTVGRFTTNRDDVQVAVGVPRWSIGRQYGRVNVFSLETTSLRFLRQLTVYGSVPFAYFGHTILAVDVDGDGLDEMLVAEPMFTSGTIAVEVGRVLIYANLGGRFGVVPRHVVGTTTRGRLGHAMVSLGDVNKDGYTDVAISAPYGDVGIVYVHLGSPNGLRLTPAQVIRATDILSLSPLGFGAALAANVDVDGNGYSDMVVGSYLSETVVLIRSRPVVSILGELTTEPAVISYAPDDSRHACLDRRGRVFSCLKLTLCFRYSTDVIGALTEISYRITIDRPRRDLGLVPRAVFNKTGNFRYSSFVAVPSDETEGRRCDDVVVRLRHDFADRTSPIEMIVKYGVPNDERPKSDKAPLRDPLSVAVNDTEDLLTLRRFVHFSRSDEGCGTDGNCVPDLRITASDVIGGGEAIVLGLNKTIAFRVAFDNAGENGYDARLVFVARRAVTFVHAVLDARDVVCDQVQNSSSTMIVCEVGDPLAFGVARRIDVVVTTANLPLTLTELVVDVSLLSINLESVATMNDNAVQLRIGVKAKADVIIEGTISPLHYVVDPTTTTIPRVVTNETEIGRHVNASFFVTNRGPTTIPQIVVRVAIPTERRSSGDRILYVLSVDVAGNGYCADGPLVNPLGIATTGQLNFEHEFEKIFNSAPVTKGGQLSDETYGGGSSSGDGAGDGLVEVDMCRRVGDVHCQVLSCFFDDVAANDAASVRVVARLWESSYARDLNDFVRLQVSASAEPVGIPTLVEPENGKPNVVGLSFTIVSDSSGKSESAGVPAWLIAVISVGSLLAVAIALLVLWKLGFFRRKVREKLVEEKRLSRLYLDDK